MKTRTFVLSLGVALLFCIGLSSFVKAPPEDPDFAQILKELVALGGVIGGINPEDGPEEQLLWEKAGTMIYMPYEQALALLKSENSLERYYGLLALSKKHLDSITPNMAIFRDTAQICFYMKKEIMCPGMALGEFATMVYEGEKQSAKRDARKAEVEQAIETFIKQYAREAGSYQSLGFSEFTWSGHEGEGPMFEVRHDYRFQSSGKGDTVTHYFILDEDLNVNVIEFPRSRTIKSYYPALQPWFEQYGRKLDHSDSLQLLLVK